MLSDSKGMTSYSELADGIEPLIAECFAAVAREYAKISHIGAAMAYAAWIGLESAARCAEYYGRLGCFDTGFLGTDILTEVLFDGGYGDIAGKLFSSEKLGSFLYMKRRGATTIWERWHGINTCSHSHPMFGASARQLFRGVLGIRQAEDSYGYRSVIIKPSLPYDMSYAKGSVMTPLGRLSVSLTREGDSVSLTVCAPKKMRVSAEHNGRFSALSSNGEPFVLS